MNTDNVWIVVLLLIVILVGANGMMYAMVRGMRGGSPEGKLLEKGKDLTKPFAKQDKELSELSQRVKALKEQEDKEA